MAREKYRFRMYEHLAARAPQILDEAQNAAMDLGLLDPEQAAELAKTVQPPQPAQMGQSTQPAPESGHGRDAKRDNPRRTIARIRELVKDAFGDAYDACPVTSTTTGLALCRKAAISPYTAQGTRRRSVILVPRQKPSEMLAGCLPSPPKYRGLPEFDGVLQADLVTSRAGAGPAGVTIPREDLVAALIPLSGATYAYHGINPGPVAMIANSEPKASLETVAATAEAHLHNLGAVFAMGTGIPGCGFASANDDGLPEFHTGLGELASEYDVPFLVDNSPAIPFLGPDLSKVLASAVVFGPYGPGRTGLVIGTEDIVMPILQLAGDCLLPSPEDLHVLLGLLTEARENPERCARIVSKVYDTVTSEFSHLADDFKQALRFQKTYATLSVEVNYEDTWNDGVGFPVFSAEDAMSGSHLLREGLRRMGVASISVSDASFVISLPRNRPELSQCLSLDQDRLHLEVQALVALLQILGKCSGCPL